MVDEAVDLGKQLSASFPQALLFVLIPQQRGSIDQATVVGHRRLLEDRLMAPLDSNRTIDVERESLGGVSPKDPGVLMSMRLAWPSARRVMRATDGKGARTALWQQR